MRWTYRVPQRRSASAERRGVRMLCCALMKDGSRVCRFVLGCALCRKGSF
jgi:hypothetical protein